MIDANIEVLEKDIQERIKSFRDRTENNKIKAGRVVLFTGALSALTTVLIGISSIISGSHPHYSKALSILALITSSSIPVLHGWDAFFNHKNLWMQYMNTLTGLYDLETDINHIKKNMEDKKEKKTIEMSQDIINDLYLRYKSILQETNQTWIGMRQEIHAKEFSKSTDKK